MKNSTSNPIFMFIFDKLVFVNEQNPKNFYTDKQIEIIEDKFNNLNKSKQ